MMVYLPRVKRKLLKKNKVEEDNNNEILEPNLSDASNRSEPIDNIEETNVLFENQDNWNEYKNGLNRGNFL